MNNENLVSEVPKVDCTKKEVKVAVARFLKIIIKALEKRKSEPVH